jgi:hypothetical protein
MFGNIFGMIGNYEDRCVGREDIDGQTFISTAHVTDGAHPYDTKADAEAGHAKWVAAMKAEELPAELVDCCNAEIAEFCDALSPDADWKRFPRVRPQ